jgi:hypothetical protein
MSNYREPYQPIQYKEAFWERLLRTAKVFASMCGDAGKFLVKSTIPLTASAAIVWGLVFGFGAWYRACDREQGITNRNRLSAMRSGQEWARHTPNAGIVPESVVCAGTSRTQNIPSEEEFNCYGLKASNSQRVDLLCLPNQGCYLPGPDGNGNR